MRTVSENCAQMVSLKLKGGEKSKDEHLLIGKPLNLNVFVT